MHQRYNLRDTNGEKKYVPTPVVKKHQGLADGKIITINTNPEIVRMDSRKENM